MGYILHASITGHDARWLLAGALVCVAGVATSLNLLAAARLQTGAGQRNRIMAGALIAGLAVFASHYVSLMGYRPGVEIRYAVWPTVASLALALGGFSVAAAIVLARPTRRCRLLAGGVALAGVAGMHFLGIFGLRFAGVIVWQPGLIALAIGGGLLLSLVSSGVVYGPGLLRRLATALGCTLAVVFVHLTAMYAMTVSPGAAIESDLTVSRALMTGLILGTFVLIAAAAATVGWMTWAAQANSLKRIREALDAMPDGLAFFDAEDRLVLWNHRYAEVNPELSPILRPGMSFREIIDVGLAEDLYADARGRQAEWVQERLDSREGMTVPMEQRITGERWLRVSDRRTAAGGIVTVCTDITDLKNDARALAEARDVAQSANSAKSQFLANMSHEIRTPLNGVIGVAQALARTDLSPQQQEMLELIQSSGQTLQVLLSDILDLARVESGRLQLADEAFDLGRAVREAAQLYETSAEAKGLQFFVDIAPEIDCWIAGDVVRIKQVLTNLVSNAVKFTSLGFVSLTAAPGPERDGAPTLRFSIEDTGIGFDSETRERLFSRFEQADGAITRRFGGSGLGLAISRQLAGLMGGDLDCESEPGGGSAFILTLPFRPVEAPQAAAAAAAEHSDVERPATRVLLADDHPVNRKVVEMILAQVKVELTAVENGAEALQACRDADFDLILMDMQMPVMDGLTATREIRLHEAAMGLSRTSIVMLTANALPDHIAAAEAAGVDRHLAKPFDAAELLDMVLNLPRAAASLAA
ncbi:MAG: response regulator [Brevundimonas sp.]|uniref:ATP-binding protein n=1 Tax=Brevundimonas sp. TaxID=1871086 RepID=UPI0027334506|nr:ATP-binding protein [Brevundimonas sp.]MDP3655599.1 response regulator [Brevundimonas sp.]